VTAGAIWSLGGLLVRGIETAGAWQILFARSLAVALMVLVILVMRYRHGWALEIRRAGWPGLVGGLMMAMAFCGFIFSVLNTTIANALFLQSASPLLAAVLGWLLLSEPVRHGTWLAMAVAMAGVGIMVGGGIVAGAWFGNLMGLLTMTGFAGVAVALRWGRATDMLPAVLWAALFTATVAAVMAPDLAMSLRDATLATSMGAAITGGMLLFMVGARTVPSVELTLLAMSEVVLAPLWVWLVFAETPRAETLIGGPLVMVALAGLALSGARARAPLAEVSATTPGTTQ
jgi:drug/metabolite transporter (DMT)-like permease